MGKLAWYLARARRMNSSEIVRRLREAVTRQAWRRYARWQGDPNVAALRPPPTLPALAVPADVRNRVLNHAEHLLARGLDVFGTEMPLPDGEAWHTDPSSGVKAPLRYAFDIDTRDPLVVGNHKSLLEPSRLQHVTSLAAAYFVDGDERFAEAAAGQLLSWWAANPVLIGVHWTSGIEVGLRMVSLAWVRRLLENWPGVEDLFERSADARRQIYFHQKYLAQLNSPGSSANNHLIAEMLGLFLGSSVFRWFDESDEWTRTARGVLEREAARQVFPDGLSREQASDYHGFVLEMLLLAATEGLLTGRPFSEEFTGTIVRMADAWAAILDVTGRPPRQGDTDDAYALVLDPPDREVRPLALLAAARALIGPSPWWPSASDDLRSLIVSAACPTPVLSPRTDRPMCRPNNFADAGLMLLRDPEPRPDELWCRVDHGPHGYLAIAAHAHADALSIELRHGGTDLLVDPGTYCYMSDPVARHYFRSTAGHNTLEVEAQDQAQMLGPFLWADPPDSMLIELDDAAAPLRWTAVHHGYSKLPGSPVHRRTVALDLRDRSVEVRDLLENHRRGGIPVRLAWHFGPNIACRREGNVLALHWNNAAGAYSARMELPKQLEWSSVRGGIEPLAGWYSPRFGERVPATAFLGSGLVTARDVLLTKLKIERERSADSARSPR